MKLFLRRLFGFILHRFEAGDDVFSYQPMNRKILIAVGFLFSVLGGVSLLVSSADTGGGRFIPVIVFGGVALVCFVVGFLGTDRAVAKIWGNK